MEGFMYRCHPQIPKLLEVIKNKTIGEISHQLKLLLVLIWVKQYQITDYLIKI